jgi:UDP-3-O-[3-hydroxymyristoyl] glucosamine N-acyltransferase
VEERPSRARSVGELAALVGGELQGDADREIWGLTGLAEAGPRDLSFYGNAKYHRLLATTRAGAVLVSEQPPPRAGTSFIRVPHPHLAFARIAQLLHPAPRHPAGVSPRAQVHPAARVDASATVMGLATVEAGATIGARTVLFPGVYVGEGAQVGADCVLYPNAVVREACVVGHRVIVHPSAVIGADGFGFAFDPAGPAHVKVPQMGTVRVEDDVEIGAGTCVDRATFGETVVGRGAKIDNLVQIAHNVKVGPLSILCAQVGISGSSEVGQGAVLAGQVGIVGHIKVGNLAKVGAQSGVTRDVADGETVSGTPAFAHPEWLRASVAFKDLAALTKEVRALRQRLEALEKEQDG